MQFRQVVNRSHLIVVALFNTAGKEKQVFVVKFVILRGLREAKVDDFVSGRGRIQMLTL